MATSDHSRVLRGNLAVHAARARREMGLSSETVAKLSGIDLALLDAVERGTADDMPIDDLLRLARFPGLTADGTPRPKPPGATDRTTA